MSEAADMSAVPAPDPPRWARSLADQRFPEFTWDRLGSLWELAKTYRGDTVDLSIGAPADATPAIIRKALTGAANAPAYPLTEGPSRLRHAVIDYLARRHEVRCLDEQMVLPTIGSKELIGALPAFLGLGPDDAVALPDLGYPTYEIGALAVGATMKRYVDPLEVDTAGVALMWVNSPGNPTGRVLRLDELRGVVARCRASGTLLVSDECYLDFAWTQPAVSALHPKVCGNDASGVLVVSSLSKRSNLAGFRAGFLVGDRALVTPLLEYRKHMGQMVPTPIQAAMITALEDDEHVEAQRTRYSSRRSVLQAALEQAGFAIDHSDGGLYFWVRRNGESCWQIAEWFARLGVICVPGEIYGDSGRQHVRLTITVSDRSVGEVGRRMAAMSAHA